VNITLYFSVVSWFRVVGLSLPKVAEFETQVISYRSKGNLSTPSGIKEPDKICSEVTNFRKYPKFKSMSS
jgi:5-methylcytosine-specific restriction protein A